MTKISKNYSDVAEMLGQYFDGLYNCDAPLLGHVFHPKAQLATVSEGNLATVDIPGWLEVVAKRESPASRKEARVDRILSIEFGSQNTASARVQCAIGPKLFTDFLSLVLLADGWKIMAKVYQFEPLD
ncbi:MULTISPECIES: nuclear transport factor 2 family protein [unclassified Mesorhizobium]|uniref:nuclear transport factor 2 family protein n=1 Tax=unclassified Mesorhizobium TaxID=325217 RepID=UPI0010928817|nr:MULTISPECIES: nuclear transport factor 2 family protein [unclassified Mesorhizobium]TGS43741.1 nuclear transport factor 2 family protein [Mesorhizobium sp. M8A.F.Ca.ET.182.01.1.1]TGS78322.1 nuclear transport factor 2 family protein [Mesorhizobium sp. M8A.F.Ca.ET.181.01.1.1]TGV15460.1 nuclear transport factor 2 family protein [Mesorhizobium sp. M8A.F.Ca.ET.173.01.1.1]